MGFLKEGTLLVAFSAAVSAQICTPQSAVNDAMELANAVSMSITEKCQRQITIQACLDTLPSGESSVAFAQATLDETIALLDGACEPIDTVTEGPTISTRDQSIVFSAEHLKIKRRSREELSLFDMYDEVMNVRADMSSMYATNEARLEAQSSTIGSILGPMQSTLGVAMQNFGNVEGRVSVVETHAHSPYGPCMPGVEFQSGVDDDGKPVCQYLRASCPAGQWPAGMPTRTADRGCEAWTECGDDEFETTPGTGASDRICQACLTEEACTARGHVVTAACTATTDTVCEDSPGKTRSNPATSCTAIKKQKDDAESGKYWVNPGGDKLREVFCEMERWGGGWMRVGHQRSGDWVHCWRTSGDCNIGRAPGTTKIGEEMGTWKYADSFINAFNYDVLWGEYTSMRQGGQRSSAGGLHIWHRGRAVGGCTLEWNRMVQNECGCTYDGWSSPSKTSLPDQSHCCGWRNHGCHRGLGDWPCRGGEATLNHCHDGGHTYITGHRQGSSAWDENGRSHMNQWIRVKF